MVYDDLVFNSPEHMEYANTLLRANSTGRYSYVFAGYIWKVGNTVFKEKQEAINYFLDRLKNVPAFNSSLVTTHKHEYRFSNKHKKLKLKSLVNIERYNYDKERYEQTGARGLYNLLPTLKNYLEPTCLKKLTEYLKKEIKKLPPEKIRKRGWF